MYSVGDKAMLHGFSGIVTDVNNEYEIYSFVSDSRAFARKYGSRKVLCSGKDLVKIPNEEYKIVIIRDENEVIAKKYYGKAIVATGVAKCCPEDTFDFDFGAKLALERCCLKKSDNIDDPFIVRCVEIGKYAPGNVRREFKKGSFYEVHDNWCKGYIFNDDTMKIEFTDSFVRFEKAYFWEEFKKGSFYVKLSTKTFDMFMEDCSRHRLKWKEGEVATMFRPIELDGLGYCHIFVENGRIVHSNIPIHELMIIDETI